MNADQAAALLSRVAWLGALGSVVAWLFVVRQVWRVEGSLHHLVAREMSALTMIMLDVAVLIFFWPGDIIRPIVVLNPLEARALVGFVVGSQVMAAYWQLTAPAQGRVKRPDGSRSE